MADHHLVIGRPRLRWRGSRVLLQDTALRYHQRMFFFLCLKVRDTAVMLPAPRRCYDFAVVR